MRHYIILIYLLVLSLGGCAHSPKSVTEIQFDELLQRRCGPTDPDEFPSRDECVAAWKQECIGRRNECAQMIRRGGFVVEVFCRGRFRGSASPSQCVRETYADMQAHGENVSSYVGGTIPQPAPVAASPGYSPGPYVYNSVRIDELEHQQRQMQCQQANIGNRVNAVCP